MFRIRSNAPSPLMYRSQRGVIIIVALVMLLVMTTLGVTTMTGATLNERIASNSSDQQIARRNAEAALLAAEAAINGWGIGNDLLASDIANNNPVPTIGFYSEMNINGLVHPGLGNITLLLSDGGWNNANSIPLLAGLNNTALPPRYIIELVECMEGACAAAQARYRFNVFAIGWGVNANTFSVIQATYLSGRVGI